MSLGLVDAYQLIHEGTVALAVVQQNGIRIDADYCRQKVAWLDRKIEQAERRLKRTRLYEAWEKRYGAKVNYGSIPQLRSVLYADLGVKSFKQTEKGEDSADDKALRRIEVEGIDQLLLMRKYRKVRDFLLSFLRYEINGRIYPQYLLHTVQTYRSSSSSPNMQNVPVRDTEAMEICRRAIIPSPGNQILEIDKSGIEVGIAACYHQDPTMLKYLADPSSDMHADTALELFFLKGINAKLKELPGGGTLRQASKNGFVFPQFYGDFYEQCAVNLACNWLRLPQVRDWRPTDGIEFRGEPIGRHLLGKGIEALSDYTEHVRRVERDFWGRRFPVYKRWREDWYAAYQKSGEFEMKTGFRCHGTVLGRNQATNYPVQGAAFHCLLKTLILMSERIRGWRSKIVGEIHDSILFDAHPDEVSELVRMMTDIVENELPKLWPWIIVQLRVEAKVSAIDGSWAQMEVI